MTTRTPGSQKDLTPAAALQLLEHGNKRFLANSGVARDHREQVASTADGQNPFAAILSCIDSRASAELLFDQGIGDIFSVRIAGNVLNEDILGSLEFACQLAGSKLIVVMGHSSCGAVKGACAGAELGHLTGLLGKLKPAIDEVAAKGEATGDEIVQRVAEVNVDHVVAQIRQRSEVLEALIASGEVAIVGAMYSVQTGAVTFGTPTCAD